jgi:hypothetical protein
MIWIVPILLLTIVLMHELGHYIAAKLLRLQIDKFRFVLKPLPHFYISIIDNKITTHQRTVFLLGGNIMILFLFVCFLLTGFDNRYIYYILVYQILVDTNPFFSDYVIIITMFLFRKFFIPNYADNPKNENEGLSVNKLKELYMFSPVWYIHCFLWGALIVLLISPIFFNNYI